MAINFFWSTKGKSLEIFRFLSDSKNESTEKYHGKSVTISPTESG
jgi:hypothetical protein